jgi:hypothetical protein
VINGLNDRVEDRYFDWVLDSDIGISISSIINNDLDGINDVVLDLLIKGGNDWVVSHTPRPFEPCQGLFLTTQHLTNNCRLENFRIRKFNLVICNL